MKKDITLPSDIIRFLDLDEIGAIFTLYSFIKNGYEDLYEYEIDTPRFMEIIEDLKDRGIIMIKEDEFGELTHMEINLTF